MFSSGQVDMSLRAAISTATLARRDVDMQLHVTWKCEVEIGAGRRLGATSTAPAGDTVAGDTVARPTRTRPASIDVGADRKPAC